MKYKLMITTVCMMMLAAFTNSTFAQDQEHRTKLPPEERTERRLERMKKELGLTEEQSVRIKVILLAQEQELAKDETQRREKIRKLNDELNSILTPEQKEKRKQLMSERRDKMKEKRLQKKESQE